MPDMTAKLRKVIWRSLENDFTIAAFQPEDGPEFIATGDLFTPSEGITYEMSGEWTEHAKYGKQFKIDSYCVRQPVDSESIAVYLEKHVVGIGPVLADKLIEKYGKHTIAVLKAAPERVSFENKGISYDLAVKISEQLQEGDKRQDVLIQIEGLLSKVKGLPKRLAGDLMNVYGLTAYEVVKSNPYVLTGMNRVGFISADKVAMACGVKPDNPERIKAGIIYVVKQTMQDTGDIWLNPKAITVNLMDLISGVKPAYISLMAGELINDQTLTEHNGFVTLARFADDENTIADCVVKFLN
jgi:exodeoxyribonuclease V alpha subunit